MGIKSKEVVCAKMKDSWVKLNVDAIKESMKKIYQATYEKDINMALVAARDYYRGNQELQNEVGFISKLIQYEASGFIEPPINVGKLYREVVRSMVMKEGNRL